MTTAPDVGALRMELLKARWTNIPNALIDLSAGLLGSFLILNVNSERDAKHLAYNAGSVLAARALTELLEIYVIGRLSPVLELLVGIAVWYALHMYFNPDYSDALLKRLLPGTVVALLAIQRALGKC